MPTLEYIQGYFERAARPWISEKRLSIMPLEKYISFNAVRLYSVQPQYRTSGTLSGCACSS
jgi:hypothetical protein